MANLVNSICIKNIATYDNETVELGKVNFFYGQNGSGKTTISRVFEKIDEDDFSECSIDAHNDFKALVYNRDFIENNFNESKLKGVFTLGEDAEEAKIKIEKIEARIYTINQSDQTKENSREIKRLEKDSEDTFIGKTWKVKQKYENTLLSNFMYNFKKNKDNFKHKLFEKYVDFNDSDLKDLAYLNKNIEELYGNELKTKNEIDIDSISFHLLLDIENDDLLNDVIIGKEDSPLSGFIKESGNNDWVDTGRKYLNENDKCPFCQQLLKLEFKQQIEEYFDETYKSKKNQLQKLYDTYDLNSKQIIMTLKKIDENEKLSKETKLKDEIFKLEKQLISNLQLLAAKLITPSNKINLQDSESLKKLIQEEVSKINNKIRSDNDKLENIEIERETLEKNMWNFIIKELLDEINTYNLNQKKTKSKLEKNSKYSLKYMKSKEKLNIKLLDLRNQTVNIDKPIENINKILQTMVLIILK